MRVSYIHNSSKNIKFVKTYITISLCEILCYKTVSLGRILATKVSVGGSGEPLALLHSHQVPPAICSYTLLVLEWGTL